MWAILSFGVLGYWLGLVIRARRPAPVRGGTRWGIVIAVGVVLIVVLAALGWVKTAGILGGAAAVAASHTLALEDYDLERLKKRKALVWLPVVFVASEIARGLVADTLRASYPFL